MRHISLVTVSCLIDSVLHYLVMFVNLRLLELAPRRTSSRVLQKIKQKEEEGKQSTQESKDDEESKETPDLARENRAKRRNLLR